MAIQYGVPAPPSTRFRPRPGSRSAPLPAGSPCAPAVGTYVWVSMGPIPHTHRRWFRFLLQALGGGLPEGLESGAALDLAAAFCRCRALALFAIDGDGRLALRAASAALRGQEAALEKVPGSGGDAAALASLALAAPASAWPLAEILEHPDLTPVRGLALGLECLGVSIHPPEGGAPRDGFLLALWEEETPPASSLDRAQLAGLALGAAETHRQGHSAASPAEDAARVKAGVLKELEALSASGDPLAGLAPHSRLLEDLDAAVADSAQRGQPLALVLVDADDLAAVNREHGPQAGDRLLKEIASILLEESGGEDLVVRYGMEEFAVLVHGGDPERARRRARAIQRRVQEQRLPGPSGSRPGSVSVGVACLPDALATDGAALRLKAEQALELARQKRPGGLIIL